ncbi:MAG: TIGR03663 family protein [Euryarchaeota archaeon]|nr:TIGR03663 family protein [Euryarchaeota archaeon]
MKAADFFSKLRENLTFERLFLIILLVSLFVRLYNLDLKLFHHDEAVHAWFSFRLLTEGVYQYDPMFHGPLLYYVTTGMFSVFGDSDLVGRIVPSILGVLLIPLVFLIYRLGYLDKKQTLIAALFIAISPEMVYFSRFLRNDIFIIFFTLLLLVALLYYLEYGKFRHLLVGAVATGLGMSSKENMPVVILIFGSFLVYLVWKGKIQLPIHWKRDFILATIVVVGIMAVLYSSFGNHPEVLADGWIKAIEHWTSMHRQERLGGPPYFYILFCILYELPILLLAVFATGQFIMDGKKIRFPWGQRTREVAKDFHSIVRISIDQLKDAGAARLASLSGFSWISGTDKKKEFMRFCIYWMVISFAVYAYIGEKVPWLILHQLLPMIFVAVYRMTDRKAVVAVIMSVFLIVMTLHVAFTPADISEPIVQVQNSEDVRIVMEMIDASDKVAIPTSHYWPLPWYYRGGLDSKISYITSEHDEDTFESSEYDLVILHDEESYPSLKGYEKQEYKLSYWFSAYDNMDRLLPYYIFRDGKVGSINWDVFVRNNMTI